MKKGFTLIELLVVVLIIGILAAVAMPQYQKAVEKSKSVQALTLLKSVVQAQEANFMASGEYSSSFDDLAVNIPWAHATDCWSSDVDCRSQGDWNIGIQNNSGYTNIHAIRRSGKYKGAGFEWVFQTTSGAKKDEILCFERTSGASILFDSHLPAGAYCVKIFKAKLGSGAAGRYYTLS